MMHSNARLAWAVLATLISLTLCAGCDGARRAAREAEVDARAPDARADSAVDGTLPADLGTGDAFVPFSTAPCEPRGGMVGVPFADGTCYLMDPRPVSQGEYHAAVQAAPLVSAHAACSGKPPGVGPRSAGGPGEDPSPFEHKACFLTEASHESPREYDDRLPWPPSVEAMTAPMVCVSWCDADAYCFRQGKRLCGVRGTPGEQYSELELGDVERSEMINGCRASGRVRYATGQQAVELVEGEMHCGGGGQVLWIADSRCPDWEGAYEGLWSLGRAIEFVGPWPWAYVYYDVGYGEPNSDESAYGCNPIPNRLYQRGKPVWETSNNRGYTGATTFRCCADYDTFE